MSRPEFEGSSGPSGGSAESRPGRGRRGSRTQGGAEPAGRETSNGRSSERPGQAEAGRAEGLSGWTLRDFLIPYILLALSVQRAHGYFIEQYLRGLGLANIELSTLYRTLRQLERDGLVCSTWEAGPEGPARRMYSLTDAGRWWLDAGAAALAGYRSLIDRFFGSYSGLDGGGERDEREKGAP